MLKVPRHHYPGNSQESKTNSKGTAGGNVTLQLCGDKLATNGGHNQLEETMSTLGVQFMMNFVQSDWVKRGETMMKAIPDITVIIDGSWSKRSHKHSYNAKSGVAIIMGKKEMGKLLHNGVSNKYCSACTQGISQDKDKCYKKWDTSS